MSAYLDHQDEGRGNDFARRIERLRRFGRKNGGPLSGLDALLGSGQFVFIPASPPASREADPIF